MMNELRQLLEDYETLCAGSAAGPWSRLHAKSMSMKALRVSTTQLDEAPDGAIDQAVQDQIETFAPTQGWLCRQSSIEPIGVPWGPDGPHDSPILDGELVNGKKESLHIRHLGQGWITTRYVEADGEDFLAEETCFQNEYADPGVSANQELIYARYWTIERDQAIVAHARFLGFRS